MSILTRPTVEKIAHLARLAITEEETSTHVKNLSAIFELVAQIKMTNTVDISPMAHPLDIPQPLRSDEVTEKDQRKLLQSIADSSAIKSGLYSVPKAY
jgi:aspartyl-tRNA(Asn)/glutamyl-tRNA(Gln) amidotransferase subunit C